jgi:hypothetical protein
MAWVGKSHPVEVLADWVAPVLLGGAAAWAASAAGLPLVAKVGSGVMALTVGVIAMRLAGRAPLDGEAGFEPVKFEPQDEEDVLLLDDPLVEPSADSRVVKLFARKEPTPGELVLRISDYLSEQGKSPAVNGQPVDSQQKDASASLHAALANIRANLR